MKISQISYSQSKETMYGIGLKRWDKCAVEIQIEENDNPENAFQMAKQLVNEQIEKSIAMDDECRGVKVRDISPEESRLSATQSIINDINTCKEVKVLESYRLIAKSNHEIQTAYDNKLKLLNNGL